MMAPVKWSRIVHDGWDGLNLGTSIAYRETVD